ncbi:hypothetical protein GCM10023195_09010 [Actinoallomurus liliacearum]|uniref:Secreted protein n=1 Tax=Actinoallomurus liliacearum TaxID=1080073 RepID=A0ABP8TAZ6_9ACTN
MHLGTKIGSVVGAGALGVAVLAATARPASAGTDDVHPMSGCRLGIICGTVYNNTTHNVEVCLAWNGNGSDQAYQTSGKCDSIAYAAPHSVYGTPQLKDVDAIYIPSGTTYYGAYSGIPKEWTHTGNGWWKFASTVDVHIDWTS